MLDPKFKILLNSETYTYNIFENIWSITKTQTMGDNQSQRIRNAFGRIYKNTFFMFGKLYLNQFWSELIYQSFSMKLIISFINVVKWILDFKVIESSKASRVKVYPSNFQNFLLLWKRDFEFYRIFSMIFHKGLPNWKLVDLGYFWSGHFMF